MQGRFVCLGSTPKRRSQECSQQQVRGHYDLAGRTDHDTALPVLVVTARQTKPNLTVNSRCRQNSGTRAGGQIAQPQLCASVVAFCQLQKFAHTRLKLGLDITSRVDQRRCGDGTHHGCGQITPSHQGIGLHIPANISELHGNAQINSVRQRCTLVSLQDFAHHQTHGTGHLVAIAKQGVKIDHLDCSQV